MDAGSGFVESLARSQRVGQSVESLPQVSAFREAKVPGVDELVRSVEQMQGMRPEECLLDGSASKTLRYKRGGPSAEVCSCITEAAAKDRVLIEDNAVAALREAYTGV